MDGHWAVVSVVRQRVRQRQWTRGWRMRSRRTVPRRRSSAAACRSESVSPLHQWTERRSCSRRGLPSTSTTSPSIIIIIIILSATPPSVCSETAIMVGYRRRDLKESGRFDCKPLSGGASAAKEPGHFEVRTSSSQVAWMHFFPQKKLTTSKHKGRQRRWDSFTVKI